ncbi:hypothetical protein ACOMHN_055389 [Nucella lapillus]
MCCFDGKSHTRLTPFFTGASTPKECVTATSLCQLDFVGKACLTEGRNVNFVASKSLATSAVLLSGLFTLMLSSRVLTFHDAKVSTVVFFFL